MSFIGLGDQVLGPRRGDPGNAKVSKLWRHLRPSAHRLKVTFLLDISQLNCIYHSPSSLLVQWLLELTRWKLYFLKKEMKYLVIHIDKDSALKVGLAIL